MVSSADKIKQAWESFQINYLSISTCCYPWIHAVETEEGTLSETHQHQYNYPKFTAKLKDTFCRTYSEGNAIPKLKLLKFKIYNSPLRKIHYQAYINFFERS